MKSATLVLISFAFGLASSTAIAGESPYNPNAKPKAQPDYYYVCVALSRDFTTRYVSSVGDIPKPWKPDTVGTISQAWSQYLAQTLGANKVMNAHCSQGTPEKQMQDYRADELTSKRYPNVVAMEWHYGEPAHAAAGSQ
jgi:hypothetical protein